LQAGGRRFDPGTLHRSTEPNRRGADHEIHPAWLRNGYSGTRRCLARLGRPLRKHLAQRAIRSECARSCLVTAERVELLVRQRVEGRHRDEEVAIGERLVENTLLILVVTEQDVAPVTGLADALCGRSPQSSRLASRSSRWRSLVASRDCRSMWSGEDESLSSSEPSSARKEPSGRATDSRMTASASRGSSRGQQARTR
jgi:Mg-chelatase subunit ChlI